MTQFSAAPDDRPASEMSSQGAGSGPTGGITAAQLTALLGSRICHDLISPLGAIGNGVELLQMSGVGDSAEMSLIAESVDNANARIRLFRVAFGAAAPGQALSQTEVRAILAPLGAARRISVDWQAVGDVPRDIARLAFLLLLCCETALPWGGTIVIDRDGRGRWRIEAQADRIRHDPVLWSGLHDAQVPVPSAAEVHFPLARAAAEAAGRTIITGLDDRTLSLVF